MDEACNLRFHAFQHLADLIPDNEEVILEWEHPNTQAALHLLYRSAVDHFLIDDFELSAAVPPLKTSLCFSPGRSRLMFKYLHSLPSVPSL